MYSMSFASSWLRDKRNVHYIALYCSGLVSEFALESVVAAVVWLTRHWDAVTTGKLLIEMLSDWGIDSGAFAVVFCAVVEDQHDREFGIDLQSFVLANEQPETIGMFFGNVIASRRLAVHVAADIFLTTQRRLNWTEEFQQLAPRAFNALESTVLSKMQMMVTYIGK